MAVKPNTIKLFEKFIRSFPERARPHLSPIKPVFVPLGYYLLACKEQVVSLKTVIKNHSEVRAFCKFSGETAEVGTPLVFDSGIQAPLTSLRLTSGQNAHLWGDLWPGRCPKSHWGTK